MPTLDWIGKKAVINHHNEVPFHLLREEKDLSAGEPGSGNLIVEGDNLVALKALLPYYAGKVKCIYIDPPYNTGNENWVYNDNVNSPEIRKWLGKVVGGEAEDLSRHDKWLCMMYPRLSLLREMLREDGAIFISIDDNEINHLRDIMDEVFGNRNLVTTLCWQKIYTVKNSARHFSEMHDFIVVYARNLDLWQRNLLMRSEKQDRAYSNPDNDPRGPWKATPLHARNFYSQGLYSISCPSGRVIDGPPKGTYWRYPEAKYKELAATNQIWWGKAGASIPSQKRFLSDVKEGVVPATMWFHDEAGHNAEAKNELRSILHDVELFFITPKPVRLVTRILEIASDPDSLILDSFAGSGTTGHAVLQLNVQNGGNRRFILVEMEAGISRGVTSERLRRVCQGYVKPDGTPVDGLGGGFRYCTLGEPCFDETGRINPRITYDELARHVFFTETGEPLPEDSADKQPLIGIHGGRGVYLLYNGILKDKKPNGGNVLTHKVLAGLPPHSGPKVIFGTACRLSPPRLKKENVIFRQIPYEIRVK
jgi:adenine-specific DNA-methyltransferase